MHCGILAWMHTFRSHGRRWWVAAIGAALLASLVALWLRYLLEHAARARIEAAAARHGWVAHIGQVHVGVWPWLQLEGFDLDLGSGVRAHADDIAATWPGHLRLAIRAAALARTGGIKVNAPATTWDVANILGEDLRFTLVEPQGGLSIRKLTRPMGSEWQVEAHGLDVGHLLDVRRDAHPLLSGGIADGRVDLQASADALRFHTHIRARGARLGALADSAADEPQLGDPTDVSLQFDGAWWALQRHDRNPRGPRDGGRCGALRLARAARSRDRSGLSISHVGVQRLDFAQLLGASGLAVPESLGMTPAGSHDLGSATIDVHVRGRLADPASLTVTQKIDFKPPRQMPPAIARLRGNFTFSPDDGSGPHRPVDVSSASPDFIALRDVPPLFVRTLLLAEDTGFYGHRGIDLRELPTALLTNLSRGGAARGASTITQQLAKNLFLSRDKQLGRKLQELAITFLLESALGKDRILEIYLNIIEWGPGLRGLRPAARSYFGREPSALTPAQMAFLVSIIPGPIKYQGSFAHGTPGPGLRALIDELLAKLRSVDAIGEEEYRRALGEDIVVEGGRAPG